MREEDYILATDLAKLRIAFTVLNTIAGREDIRVMKELLYQKVSELEHKINRESNL